MKKHKTYLVWGILVAMVFQGYCVLALQASAGALPANSSVVKVHPISPETREKEWQQELSNISDIEKAPLIFQVNLKDVAPRIASQKARGSATMKMLAIATNTQWTEIEGIQLFLSTADASTDVRLTTFSNWLQDLTPEQRKGFLEGNFDFQKMPLALQATLLHLIGGWYPQIYQDILNEIDNIRLQVTFGPQLAFQIHGTIYDIQNRKGKIEMRPILYNPQGFHSISLAQISKMAISKPLNGSSPAKLDFGVGQILPLSEINTMAEQTYRKTFSLPQNVEEQLFFVSGQITEAGWTQTLQKIIRTPVSPVKQEDTKNQTHSLMTTLLENEWKAKSEEDFDLTWMRQRKVVQDLTNQKVSITTDSVNAGLLKMSQNFGTEESLPISWFLTGHQTSLGELTKDRPGLATYFESYHLEQNTPITLQATVALAIDTPKAALTLPFP